MSGVMNVNIPVPGADPIIFNLDDMKKEMLEALTRGSHPTGRFLNGRIVVVLATPDNGTAKDVAIGLSAIPAGLSTEEHFHPAEEIATVLAGKGTIYIDDVPFEVGPGSVIYTPSMARHRTEVTGDEVYLSWWMYSPAGSESRWLPSKGFEEPIATKK
ncbi:MAG: cupin domain-containing protein [Actinobacteria bacterium]|nr:cupin domain-containing protein [Actinomycetota bacterium]MSW34686.1 cupin domain-containing protein [Actinomycetota bacterium]MSX52063.1 cupin domain-containing protein [Actinomycetota bacterium]MSY50371.1 cupin domain-containing protein [Actinomycetota bacterium]MSY74617.1 cupin domain-containing protein [Actinomycetota bacterium]